MEQDYEQHLRTYVLHVLSSGATQTLDAYVQQLIEENEAHYAQIIAAHLAIQREILG